MAKKIEGWSDPFACFVEGPEKPDEIYCSFFPTTQVVHDGDKHEPVYTASEVRAMLKEIVDAREAVRNSPEGMVWATPRQDIEVIASKHGINIADVAVPKADHA